MNTLPTKKRYKGKKRKQMSETLIQPPLSKKTQVTHLMCKDETLQKKYGQKNLR
jgi:hypothetical protein